MKKFCNFKWSIWRKVWESGLPRIVTTRQNTREIALRLVWGAFTRFSSSHSSAEEEALIAYREQGDFEQ